MEKQLVIFSLSNEYFGIDISTVEGIVKIQEITKIPEMPEFMEGVTNLRGEVLPVINLERRFGIPPHKTNNESRIVVVNVGKMKVGMIVESVSEVLTIDDTQVEPAPALVTSLNSRFITGIARVEKRLVILLDLGLVLSAEDIEKTSGALAETAHAK
jgi:purine-binding chemotaxis protein CheW